MKRSLQSEVSGFNFELPMQLFNQLRSLGYKAEHAAGVVGNWMSEGGHNGALNPGQKQVGGGGGYGLYQITDPTRKAEFNSFLKRNNMRADDPNAQVAFHEHEIRGDAYNGYYKKHALEPLMKTTTPEQASRVYAERFENPKRSTAHFDRREAFAREIYNRGTQQDQQQGNDANPLIGKNDFASNKALPSQGQNPGLNKSLEPVPVQVAKNDAPLPPERPNSFPAPEGTPLPPRRPDFQEARAVGKNDFAANAQAPGGIGERSPVPSMLSRDQLAQLAESYKPAIVDNKQFAQNVPASNLPTPGLNRNLDPIQQQQKLADVRPNDFGRNVPNNTMSGNFNPRLDQMPQLADIRPNDFGRSVPNSTAQGNFNPQLQPVQQQQLASIGLNDFGRNVPSSNLETPNLPQPVPVVSDRQFAANIPNSTLQTPGLNRPLDPILTESRMADVRAPQANHQPDYKLSSEPVPVQSEPQLRSPVMQAQSQDPVPVSLQRPELSPLSTSSSALVPTMASNDPFNTGMGQTFDFASLFEPVAVSPDMQLVENTNNDFGSSDFGGFDFGSMFG